MRYVLTFSCLSEQLISIQIMDSSEEDHPEWFLPYWRPGRYEQQRYDINIKNVKAEDSTGNPLEVVKTSSHSWEIQVKRNKDYILSYEYYANKLDAGGSYVDHQMIYINGINLFLYKKGTMELPCELVCELPEGFILPEDTFDQSRGKIYSFKDYHALVDTPFVASLEKQEVMMTLDSLQVRVSIHGEKLANLETLIKDIEQFSRAQIKVFGDIPVDSYTYWLILLPYRYRHGVEHLNSTVIVIGPWYRMMAKENYDFLLEICCHEFFHLWNVKSFRPKELTPYDYSQAIYSKLHYITEGITTYYGYIMLWRSGIWTFQDWIKSFNEELAGFYRSGGKNHVSLEEASINSWVNGYHNKGVPNQRISFYTKGHLVALLMDYYIRSKTEHRVSLDDIMRELYQFCKSHEQGYQDEDFQRIFESTSGVTFTPFYEAYIKGVDDLKPLLSEFADFMGLRMVLTPFDTLSESVLGLKVGVEEKRTTVQNCYPDSIATQSGIMQGDQLIALDGHQIGGDWDELLATYRGKSGVTLHYFHRGRLKETSLSIPKTFFNMFPQFSLKVSPRTEQLKHRNLWAQI